MAPPHGPAAPPFAPVGSAPPFAPPRTTQPRMMPPMTGPATPAPAPPAVDLGKTQPIPAVSPSMAAAPALSPPAADAPAGPPRRVINPFLANDPNQKAKRLARALVSDMVAYLPQKRDEGLKNGTLKQLFREEIKKSYEEYCDQIGKEFAESTTHFQEALNDVLAGGKKIF